MSKLTTAPKAKPRGKPWAKGQSGNPGGRPHKFDIRAAIQDFLSEKAENGDIRFVEAVTRLYVEDIKTFFAYGFGKPTETTIVQNPDGTGLFDSVVIAMAQAKAKGK